MNEIEAYEAVYGDLVNCVPHYSFRVLARRSPAMAAMRDIRMLRIILTGGSSVTIGSKKRRRKSR
jgi:hypothetical protein